jgi:hypothetical protein
METGWSRQLPSPPCKLSAPAAWKETMTHTHNAVLKRPEAANLARSGSRTRYKTRVLPLAICAALVQCLASVQADDALPLRGTDAQVQKPAYVPQGRQMKRYEAFARQAELPSMTTTNNTVLQVGGVVNTDTTRLAQLSTHEKEALAGQFKVPVGVIDRLAQQLARSSPPAAGQLAQEIRTAVIDYRFLQIEWAGYHPPAEGQETKTAALEALQAGDISKAWELYDALGRPPPPTMLRVVDQP